jgi:N-acylglucosamine-6-phosphate 2-epimerase
MDKLLLEELKNSLIVSCQAPVNSPLHQPEIIAAIAQACVNKGAKGVRIDTPNHIKTVRQLLPNIPIIGLWKQTNLNSEVYITPRFEDAFAVSEAGADIIAIDATLRQRPNQEKISEIITQIQQKLGKLVMADIDTFDNAIASYQAGVDLIGTTLYGYTKETENLAPPGFSLLSELTKKLDIPIICEGGISTPEEAKKALDLGAFCVVVGTAITGIDLKTEAFQRMFPEN